MLGIPISDGEIMNFTFDSPQNKRIFCWFWFFFIHSQKSTNKNTYQVPSKLGDVHINITGIFTKSQLLQLIVVHLMLPQQNRHYAAEEKLGDPDHGCIFWFAKWYQFSNPTHRYTDTYNIYIYIYCF